jgi:hypothetical protein
MLDLRLWFLPLDDGLANETTVPPCYDSTISYLDYLGPGGWPIKSGAYQEEQASKEAQPTLHVKLAEAVRRST